MRVGREEGMEGRRQREVRREEGEKEECLRIPVIKREKCET